MERRIGAVDARNDLDRVLDEVAANRDSFVVERQGKAIAAVVPIEQYEQLKRARDGFFDRAAAIGQRAAMPPAEAEFLVQEAIAAVGAVPPR
jgi:prevent-host-death family protein